MNPKISVKDVERRILRACRTLRALPDKDRRFLVVITPAYVESIVQEFQDAYGADEARMRWRPEPADVSDYLVALAWANGLEKKEWRFIWWRSFEISFRQIGMKIGRSDETARTRYRDALLKVWANANQQAAA